MPVQECIVNDQSRFLEGQFNRLTVPMTSRYKVICIEQKAFIRLQRSTLWQGNEVFKFLVLWLKILAFEILNEQEQITCWTDKPDINRANNVSAKTAKHLALCKSQQLDLTRPRSTCPYTIAFPIITSIQCPERTGRNWLRHSMRNLSD